MLNKKITALVLVITFVLSFSIIFSANAAADDPTWFKPNVAIPGMENWLGALKPITSGPMAEGGFRGYEIDGESIGKYISGIYDFTAGFVGIIAMFMLVIAGWQWLFAAGSADKINNAKGTINGVLIGLALLFGGHIILEQISVRLTEFEGITMDAITAQNLLEANADRCAEAARQHACGSAGAFELGDVASGQMISCPGGTNVCENNYRCVYLTNSTSFRSCTVQYLMERGEGDEDCECRYNNLIQQQNSAASFGGSKL